MAAPPDERLDSWKEIATYLDRDVRTVQRWEAEESLPVRRHIHNTQVSVYAYRSEIDVWLAKRSIDFGKDKHRLLWFLSENKKAVASVAGGVTLLLLVGLVAWIDIGSPDPEGLNFQERDWVLIADFENRTGEPVFDGVLEYALEQEISNSQFVNVVPLERIEDTLQLMRKPLDTPIDRTLGREICLRDGGIKALLTGRVEKLDSTYLLSVQVVDPSHGQTIASASEEAAGQKQVLSALKALSDWSRQNLGEKLALIQESEKKLARAATPSLRAVQLFTEARTLFDRGPTGHGPAEQLLRQTLEIDPEFASACIWLAWTLANQRKSFDDYIQHAEKAFQLAATTSEQERYFIHGSYYWMRGELDKAIHAFGALLGLYPDHFWATLKLTQLYARTGRNREALKYRLRLADLRPTQLSLQFSAASDLIQVEGDLMRARSYLDRARNLLTPELIQEGNVPAQKILLAPAYEAWLSGNPQAALAEIDGVLQVLKRFGMPNPRVPALGALYRALGKGQLGRRWTMNGTVKESQEWHWLSLVMAHAQGDRVTMTNHLRQFLKSGDDSGSSPPFFRRVRSSPRMAMFLAESGFLSESETLLTQVERLPGSDPDTQLARGVLELRKGNAGKGIQFIEKALREGSNHYLSSLLLAEALSEEGELQKAVQVLEVASEKKYLVLVLGESPTMWLRVRSALAKLYRETGRNEEAREIEEELRKHLAYADPDHPILRQLDHTQELTLREPAN